MRSNDIGGSSTFTHNQNCLMGTITFEIHHITPTSPRNILATILKTFWIFLLFIFAYFFLLSISCMGIYERKENTQLCKLEHPYFAMQVLHLTEHGFYKLHTYVLWLTSFSSEMVIYAFHLGFSSHSHKKEWFKIWKIRDQPNHTNQIKQAIKLILLSCAWKSLSKLQEMQSWETFFQRPSKVHKYQFTQNTHCFCIFLIFPFFY